MSQESNTPDSPAPAPKPRRLRPQTMALLAVAVVFGLLLWAKLLLVTGHPRTALADPDAEPAAAAADEPEDSGSR